MRGVILWGVLAALAGPMSIVAPAYADDDKDRREAKERFEEGVSRARVGDWEGARRSFQQSVAVVPSQTGFFNLAFADEKCGRMLEALGVFKTYARKYPLTDEERAQARRHVAELMEKTGHIDVRAPSGAALTLDETQNAGVAPLAEPLDVTPGHHVLAAKSARGTQVVSVEAGAGQVVRALFEGAAEDVSASSAPAAGTAEGSATGPVAGGSSPPVGAAPARAGSGPGLAPSPNGSEELPPAEHPSSAGRTWLAVGLGLGSLLAIAGGVALEVSAANDQARAENLQAHTPAAGCRDPPKLTTAEQDTCQELVDATTSRANDRNLATGVFVAGGVFAAGAVTVLLWPHAARPQDARMYLAPALNGIRLMGRF